MEEAVAGALDKGVMGEEADTCTALAACPWLLLLGLARAEAGVLVLELAEGELAGISSWDKGGIVRERELLLLLLLKAACSPDAAAALECPPALRIPLLAANSRAICS